MRAKEVDSLKGFTLDVTITFKKKLHRRLWIATRLIKLAAWIMECDITVDSEILEEQ